MTFFAPHAAQLRPHRSTLQDNLQQLSLRNGDHHAPSAMTSPGCTACAKHIETIATLRAQLHEVVKLAELQKADLDRLTEAQAHPQVNRPERAPSDALQLALGRIILDETQEQAAAPTAEPERVQAVADLTDVIKRKAEEEAKTKNEPKKPHPHGRRDLRRAGLPTEIIKLQPQEVIDNPENYELIGMDVGSRLAYQPGGYVNLVIQQLKYISKEYLRVAGDAPTVLIAPLPESVWPRFMADPSAIGRHIIAKYGDCLPLHRQEKISAREGFRVSRSTQCGWLKAAHAVTSRIVDAMLDEACTRSFCIATDATGAPVRAKGSNALWHMFVMLADRDHVIFRYSEEHTSKAVKTLLGSFKGHVLADAAVVFDVLYETGDIIEVACWFHLRRYFWRGILTDPKRAYEALALIGRLFEIERECKNLPPETKTEKRASLARPILALLDAWIRRHKDDVDARGPLAAAITYYRNQRTALHAFLADGRLRLDNNPSEQQLRHLVLGRANWTFFANETGLAWYATFRSLIASCALHDINPQKYLEDVLRLAPHWPVNRMLELSPKYWARTVAALSERHKAILVPPWELNACAAPPIADAA